MAFGTAFVFWLLSLASALFNSQIGLSLGVTTGVLKADAALYIDGAADNQGVTDVTVQPNTIHTFSYTLADDGTIDYRDNTGDKISSRITNEYIPVDYVQFTGTQYIDTQIPQTTANIGVSVDYQYTDITSQSFSILFGARSAPTTGVADALMIVDNHSNSHMIFQYGNSNPQIGNAAPNLSRHVLTVSGKTVSIITGGVVGNMVTSTAAEPAVPYNIFLGAGNQAGEPVEGQEFLGNIFSFSITDDNTTIMKLDPVIEAATGECGFYDEISGNFFGNAGTGTLVCPVPTTTNPMTVLIYPGNVDDATINTEIANMYNGIAVTSPSAIDETSVLSGTIGKIYTVGEIETYLYKFVLYAPENTSLVYLNSIVYFDLSSGAQGVVALNWRQQLSLYTSITSD